MEFLLILVIALFIVIYRKSTGAVTYKFIVGKVGEAYDKYAPFSLKQIREMEIPLPPLDIQAEIVQTLDQYRSEIEAFKNEIEGVNNKIESTLSSIWQQ